MYSNNVETPITAGFQSTIEPYIACSCIHVVPLLPPASLLPATALTDLDSTTITKLLTALNECTEWGQVFILDSLAAYQPQDDKEAQSICERVTPRLSHANAAVVLSAVKVRPTGACPDSRAACSSSALLFINLWWSDLVVHWVQYRVATVV